jgi:hypothetical protein
LFHCIRFTEQRALLIDACIRNQKPFPPSLNVIPKNRRIRNAFKMFIRSFERLKIRSIAHGQCTLLLYLNPKPIFKVNNPPSKSHEITHQSITKSIFKFNIHQPYFQSLPAILSSNLHLTHKNFTFATWYSCNLTICNLV